MLYSRGYNWNKIRVLKRSSGAEFFGDSFSDIYAGYSVRKLNPDYTGAALRVRKSAGTGLEEQDIGFNVFGGLDTAALLNFVGTSATDDGFVTKWYDQFGSSDTPIPSEAKQPKIVDAGEVIVRGTTTTRPAIEFDGVDDEFANVFNAGGQRDMGFFVVSSTDEIPTTVSERAALLGRYTLYLRYTNTRADGAYPGSMEGIIKNFSPSQTYNQKVTLGDVGVPVHTIASMVNGTVNGSKIFKVRFNGAESQGVATEMTGQQSQDMFIGSRSTEFLDGHIQEVIISYGDKAADSAAIEENQNDYFNVF